MDAVYQQQRRNGRIMAVQGLYSYDLGEGRLEDILKLDWAEQSEEEALDTKDSDETPDEEESSAVPFYTEEAASFARIIISGTVNHLEEIDEIIKKHLSKNWDFSRLNKITLAILRLSILAMLYRKESAPVIIINEAIFVCKDFSSDDSYKFINGILDRIKKELKSE